MREVNWNIYPFSNGNSDCIILTCCDTQSIKAQDLKGLSWVELNALIPQLLWHVDEQTRHIGEQRRQLDSAAQAIKWRDAKIEQITFDLARLKAWKFGASSERMTAEQRELFAETLAADQADLEARLAALQAAAPATPASKQPAPKRKPKREPLPEHLSRVDTHVEPENTTCECGQAMQRVGEDVSERLDIVPAQFFVQRQIRGKWACKCCQILIQSSVESCSGTPRAWTSTRPCCRCRSTSGMRW